MTTTLVRTHRYLFSNCSTIKRVKAENLSKVAVSPEVRLDGKTAIITGCNTGIGKYTALDFCGRGCRVVMACRDIQKAEIAKRDIQTEMKDSYKEGQLIVRKLDLSSLKSIRNFSEEILKEEEAIHILVNNAGVMMCPKQETEDGFELQFGTNHLGHFLLTLLLLPRIIKSAPARIINLSSAAYRVGKIDFEDLNWKKKKYSPLAAYGRSKLANILFTKELSRRLKGTQVNAYVVHPGLVRTELGRHMDAVTFPGFRSIYRTCFGWYSLTPRQGAATSIYCAVDEGAGRETGLYYKDCKVTSVASKADDVEVAKRLWDNSWEMVGLGSFDPFSGAIEKNS